MNFDEIVQQPRDQRSKLHAAIRALEGVSAGGPRVKRRGRRPGITTKPAAGVRPKRRAMSAAARERIAEAMRKRWAAAKKSGKQRV